MQISTSPGQLVIADTEPDVDIDFVVVIFVVVICVVARSVAGVGLGPERKMKSIS